jgi:hypothetical protein
MSEVGGVHGMVVITDMIVSSKAAGWKRSALVVKRVGGRELRREDSKPVVVRVCDKIRKLGGTERSGIINKNMELYVVTAYISQEDSECGPFI